MPPARRMLSVTRLSTCARLHLGKATPITGTFRTPRLAIAYSAGRIILWARSPVTPKTTSASDRDNGMQYLRTLDAQPCDASHLTQRRKAEPFPSPPSAYAADKPPPQ